ncbi:MAG: glutaredoxin 3 [Albidovulum sp.]
MQRVEIYTTPFCPYCIAAKRLLTKKGATFEETDVSGDFAERQRMMVRAHGRNTVPQIFIGGKHVGGSDELHSLDRAGRLEPMLAG